MKRPWRIALSCQQDHHALPLPAYRFWRNYFAAALAEAGHEVLECPGCTWAEGLLPLDTNARQRWRDETWSRFSDWVRSTHATKPLDLALCYLFPDQVDATAVREISDSGVPVVNFFCDNVREFRNVPEVFRCFDLHWVPEYNAVPMYQRAKLRYVHLPMPCWVPPAHRATVTTPSLPVTFVGTKDEQRERLFADAILRGLQLELRGTGWAAPTSATEGATPARAGNPFEIARRQLAFARRNGPAALWRKLSHRRQPSAVDFTFHAKPAPMGDEYWRVLRESVVCVGVNRYPSFRHPLDAPDRYSRLRDIEAPMAGACYLTEYAPGLEHLYDLGREIETYRDAGELAEKANSLAADPHRQRQLRTAGQRRALAEHTIGRSIEQIASLLGCSRDATIS